MSFFVKAHFWQKKKHFLLNVKTAVSPQFRPGPGPLSFWVRPCQLICCPVGGLVGGCGANSVTCKTTIYLGTKRNTWLFWANWQMMTLISLPLSQSKNDDFACSKRSKLGMGCKCKWRSADILTFLLLPSFDYYFVSLLTDQDRRQIIGRGNCDLNFLRKKYEFWFWFWILYIVRFCFSFAGGQVAGRDANNTLLR